MTESLDLKAEKEMRINAMMPSDSLVSVILLCCLFVCLFVFLTRTNQKQGKLSETSSKQALERDVGVFF